MRAAIFAVVICLSVLMSFWVVSPGETTPNPEVLTSKSTDAMPVKLSSQAVKNAQLTFEKVAKVTLKQTHSFPGEIAFDKHRVSTVSSLLPGKVLRVYKHVGENVRKGEPLALISSPELPGLYAALEQDRLALANAKKRHERELKRTRVLGTLLKLVQSPNPDLTAYLKSPTLGSFKADILGALNQFVLAQKIESREKEVFDAGLGTDAQLEKVKADKIQALIQFKSVLEQINWENESQLWSTQQALDMAQKEWTKSQNILSAYALPQTPTSTFTLSATQSGTVVALNVKPGDQINSGKILEIADLSEVWAEFRVYEQDLGLLYLGQVAHIKSVASPQESQGKITHIKPLVDQDIRASEAHIHVENSQKKWKPGMFVSVSVDTLTATVPLAVKQDAIQLLKGQKVVFIKTTEGQIEPREIQTGREDREWVEVLKGLQTGQSYVSKNSFVLKSHFLMQEGGE